MEQMKKEVTSWQLNRNLQRTTVNWQFTTEDARINIEEVVPRSLRVTDYIQTTSVIYF